MASDLIDRGALFPNGFIVVNGSKPILTLNDLINKICNAPAIDAVEVVWCKDCAHKRNEGPILRCPYSTVDLEPDGFCHRGER